MAIPLTGTGGLFTIIGHYGKLASDILAFQGTLATRNAAVVTETASYPSIVSGVSGQLSTWQSNAEYSIQQIQSLAATTVIAMANANSGSAFLTRNIGTALQALINQMIGSSDSVLTSTVSASASAYSSNIGNATVVLGVSRGDNQSQQNIWPERVTLTCTRDSQTGGAQVGLETYTYTGQPAIGDPWAVNYPGGSGVTTSLQASSGSSSLISDGSFANFSGSAFANWTVATGTIGTDVFQNTTTFYPVPGQTTGTSLQIHADSSTLHQVTQTFGGSQNFNTLEPLTAYPFVIRVYVNAAPAAGVLHVTLNDGSGTTVNDNAGNPNQLSITLSGLTSATWTTFTGTFKTPAALPTGLNFSIKESTAATSGTLIYFDAIALAQATEIYPGGPLISIFSGSTRTIAGDGWNVTMANGYGSGGTLAHYQTVFDRLFNMKQLGLVLPNSGSPTIPDSGIA